MRSRFASLVSFEVQKLVARRLVLASVALVAVVAALAPYAGRVMDTAAALSKGKSATLDPFKNGWTTFAGGLGAAIPFAAIVLLVFAGTSIAEEVQQGTLKSILARPVRRVELLLAKTAALSLLALALVLAMSGAALAVAQHLFGFGDVVDPDFPAKVQRSAQEMARLSALATALLVPSFLAIVGFGLAWSAWVDHAGFAVGGAIGGYLGLVLLAGLSASLGPFLFVTYVGLPAARLSDVAEQFSGGKTLFWREAPFAVLVPCASAAAFAVLAGLRLSRRDLAD